MKDLVKSICPRRELIAVSIRLGVNFSIFRLFFGVSCFLIRVEIFHYFPRTCSKYRRRMRFAPRDGQRWPSHVGVYRDAQSFRALRKRKLKTDSTAGSGESCSKQNKAVDLLPVDLESKTGRELKAYSPVFIHNCLEKCIGSYKSCSPLRNGDLIVKCCGVQQMTTLLQCTKLTDVAVSVEITASSMRPLGARGVIYCTFRCLHRRSRGMPCKSRG